MLGNSLPALALVRTPPVELPAELLATPLKLMALLTEALLDDNMQL